MPEVIECRELLVSDSWKKAHVTAIVKSPETYKPISMCPVVCIIVLVRNTLNMTWWIICFLIAKLGFAREFHVSFNYWKFLMIGLMIVGDVLKCAVLVLEKSGFKSNWTPLGHFVSKWYASDDTTTSASPRPGKEKYPKTSDSSHFIQEKTLYRSCPSKMWTYPMLDVTWNWPPLILDDQCYTVSVMVWLPFWNGNSPIDNRYFFLYLSNEIDTCIRKYKHTFYKCRYFLLSIFQTTGRNDKYQTSYAGVGVIVANEYKTWRCWE